MFTSRAEHRLLLREDNADLRLTPTGFDLGLIEEERWRLFETKQRLSDAETERLRGVRIHPRDVPLQWQERVLNGPLNREVSAFELLRRPEVSYEAVLEVAGRPDWLSPAAAQESEPRIDERLPAQIRAQIEVRTKYAGYIERQHEEVLRQRRNEETRLPGDLDYTQVTGLSHEVRQRLTEVRPATVGQASRIPGVTPAAVSLLIVYLKKRAWAARTQVA